MFIVGFYVSQLLFMLIPVRYIGYDVAIVDVAIAPTHLMCFLT